MLNGESPNPGQQPLSAQDTESEGRLVHGHWKVNTSSSLPLHGQVYWLDERAANVVFSQCGN